jgi:hypothetical protein
VAAVNPPSGSQPAAGGGAPSSPAAQPPPNPLLAPLISLSGILTTYASLIFVLFLFTLAAAYGYTKRDVLSRYQTWITLYLISMTGVLWAVFVSAEGGPLSDSVFILTSVAGINLIVHILRFDRIQIPVPAMAGFPGAR